MFSRLALVSVLVATTLASPITLTIHKRDLVPPSPSDGYIPSEKLSPGVVLSKNVTAICTPGYTKGVRNVPDSEKNQVYIRYGLTDSSGAADKTAKWCAANGCEVDHVIPLEVGGANDITNLFPQAKSGPPSAGSLTKDRLENKMHELMCCGAVDIDTAQAAFGTTSNHTWVDSYNKYINATCT